MIDDPRRAAILAVGDELTSGARVDTNSGAIAARLLRLGIEPALFTVVGDDEARLERTLRELCAQHQVVIATGGLGPTLDDVTRHAAARAAGVPLVLDAGVLDEMRERWRRARGTDLPESNVRQALFPAGAQVMPNEHGTAPGFRVWIDGGMLACLPGPPREMVPMLEQDLLPWLERTCGVPHARAFSELQLFGLSESEFSQRAGDWMRRDARPRMGVCAHEGVLTVRLRAEAARPESAQAQVEHRAAELEERFWPHVFARGPRELSEVVVELLSHRGLSLAVAESCTGGLVLSRLVDVPGASAVLREGWVTYADEAKVARLGVPPSTLAEHGAVSAEVAGAMARGAASASGADVAVSVTGIAGPSGGTSEKPVGLVWLGLCLGGRIETLERRFPAAGRDFVRSLAANTALDLVRRRVAAGTPPGSDAARESVPPRR